MGFHLLVRLSAIPTRRQVVPPATSIHESNKATQVPKQKRGLIGIIRSALFYFIENSRRMVPEERLELS